MLPTLGLTVRMAPQPLSHPLDRRGWTSKSRGYRIFLVAYAALLAPGGLVAMITGAAAPSAGHRSLVVSMIRLETPHVDRSAGWLLAVGFLSLLAGIWLFTSFLLLRPVGEPWISQRLLTVEGDFETVFSGCMRALPAAGARVAAIDRDGLTDATSGVLVGHVGGGSRGHPNDWSERIRVRVARDDESPRMVEVTSQSIRVRFFGRRNARNVARYCSRLME